MRCEGSSAWPHPWRGVTWVPGRWPCAGAVGARKRRQAFGSHAAGDGSEPACRRCLDHRGDHATRARRSTSSPGSRAQLARHEAGHRPASVYHRKEERIRAHVILCWLALLLARVAENACHATWPQLRRELDRIAIGTFTVRPAPSASAPRSPRPSATSSPSSRSPPRPGSTSSPPPAPDQQEHLRLDTRPPPMPGRIPSTLIHRLCSYISCGTRAVQVVSLPGGPGPHVAVALDEAARSC